MGIREDAKTRIGQYYNHWDKNIQTMMRQAQLADGNVKKIVEIKDPKSLGAIVLTILIDVGLNVVLPGRFALSKSWKRYEELNKARAEATKTWVSLSTAAKGEVQSKLTLLAENEKANASIDEKRADGSQPAPGELKIDLLNQMIDKLERKLANKTLEKDATETLYDKLPSINLAQVYEEFPPPPLLGATPEDVRYAFEWTLLNHYVANSVTVWKREDEWGNVAVDGPAGLSWEGCKLIFETYKRSLPLHEDMPMIGNILRPVTTFEDLINVWGAKTKTDRRFSGMQQ